MPDQKRRLFWLILMLFLPGACLPGRSNGQEELKAAEAIQEDIEQLTALYASLSIPEHFLEQGAERRGDEFDPNQVFDILDHLEMAPGYTLDYAYLYEGMGGYPVLYARKIDQDRALFRLPDRPGQGEVDPEFDPFSHNPLNAIQADGSAEGYMQLVVFSRMGSQFYLHWHANYSDAVVITTREGLEEIVAEYAKNDFAYDFNVAMRAKALLINPEPKVVWTDDKVTVSLLYFTKWGGFFKTEYQIQRTFPHHMIMLRNENLLEYDCGIMF